MSKIKGKVLAESHGLTVSVLPEPAKTAKGKDRVWIQIRQNNGKKWRVYETLAYARGVDIQFVDETMTRESPRHCVKADSSGGHG